MLVNKRAAADLLQVNPELSRFEEQTNTERGRRSEV
jgi:hypothetical protein